MNALKAAFCVPLAVILLGALYIASSILGWVLAVLTAFGMVVCLVAAGLYGAMSYLFSGKDTKKGE